VLVAEDLMAELLAAALLILDALQLTRVCRRL
jgi:hypothetical protein